mgnify:FL=1
MKKLLAVLLALALIFSAVACATTPAAEEVEEVETAATEEPVAEAAAPEEETVVTEEAVVEEAVVTYVPLGLDFKNKTGVTITGLYLYPTGAEDKGNSFCAAEWIDKDSDPDGEHYEFQAYLVRPATDSYDVYVEFADGTNATWSGISLQMNDKLSLKDGVDPSTWELEALDDEEDIAKVAAVVAAGKTTDNSYPGYEILGLEIKNKTGKGVTEFYFYETGGEAASYNNMVPCLIDEEGNTVTVWQSGKGGLYVFNFFIRPYAETYEIYLVFEDGTDLTVPAIDLFKLNTDGFSSNEISMKDALDSDLTEVSYDDGDPEPLQYIRDAIVAGVPADAWYPVY